MAIKDRKYFLAIIPPEPLRGEIQQLKERIGATHHTRGALRSPPHITLHMPFLWTESKEDKLIDALGIFASEQQSITIGLNGYSCFRPRVVFIAVHDNPRLADLQRQLFRYCKLQLNLFNANYKDRPFHPHITLAFRDLKKDQFEILWREMEQQTNQSSFEAMSITLLKHDGHQWQEHRNFQLGKRLARERDERLG